MRPRLLDLFCGAGGAAMGYSRAGFEVVGVDIKPQPRYPFAFEQEDALVYLRRGMRQNWIARFDAIHASPPCQDYSRAMRHLSGSHPRLIGPVRELLKAAGLLWVIENVIGAPLPRQHTLDGRYGLELCGTQFGLRVSRHRLFESNIPLIHPETVCRCVDTSVINPYRASSRKRDGIESGAEKAFAEAMGIDWMRGKSGAVKSEIGEAIPPAYTEFIGHQLMQHIQHEVLSATTGMAS